MVQAYSISADAIAEETLRVEGDLGRFDVTRVVTLDEHELGEPGPDDVRVRVLAVSIEHNVVHAALADTVNIVALRGGKIFPGNCFLGEVLETGSAVRGYRRGDIVVSGANGQNDPYGYPLRAWAYDQPNSIGCYGQETILGASQLRPAPLRCGLSLWELTAAPLRAATAYHLWRRGHDIYRVKVPREKRARLNVLGFGGGVCELLLMLARHEGHHAFYCSGNPERRERLEELGIRGIDQLEFDRFATPEDVRRFARRVRRLTEGEGMHVVCDMFRGPVFAAGLAAQSRQGVNVSAGWQLDTTNVYNSAAMSLNQVTIDHAHFETIDGCGAALELLGDVFKPVVHKEIYAFADLPRALDELHHNRQSGTPVVRVAEQMPERVLPLIPEG